MLSNLNKLAHDLATILAITTAATAFSACAERAPGADGGQAGGDGTNEVLTPEAPPFLSAEGWDQLLIDAKEANTRIETNGHLITTSNMCRQKGDIPFDLPTWNALAKQLNELVKTTPATAPRCVPSPNGSWFYNKGIATLVLANGAKRPLLEYKGGEICSYVADAALSDGLIATVEKLILTADRADAQSCPNYRP